jgi:putative aminopeptidase FrvX
MKLLEQLCAIHGPTGEEHRVRDFILNYIHENSASWCCKPKIISDNIQDNLILIFGEPKYAILSHMDSTGFTLSYNKKLLQIGSPDCENTIRLKDKNNSKILIANRKEDYFYLDSSIEFPLGSTFTFESEFLKSIDKVQSPYLDNRLGIYILLELAKQMKNGILAFTSFEEHFSGGVEKVSRVIYEDYHVNQFIINDITSTSEGIKLDNGIVISLRDVVIPRRIMIDKMIQFAQENSVQYQLEVEDIGASDGAIIQRSVYPIDWCFIGVAAENMHSKQEIANMNDIATLINFYMKLLK